MTRGGWRETNSGRLFAVKAVKVLLICAVVLGFGSLVWADGPSKKEQPTTSTKKPTTTNKSVKGGFFVDVPSDHYAAADLKFLVERGIITGLPSGEFQGSKAMSRYDAAVLFARAIRYVQNDPEKVKAQELKVLQDLMFQLSQKIQSIEQKADASHGGTVDNTQIANMQNQLQSANTQIEGLQKQLRDLKVSSSSSIDPVEFDKVKKQSSANFIIAMAGLFVGIVGIALATLIK